ncbi:terpenoid cyclases/protein prenyltransferase alpha-alpha toroid [Aspergillus avenaceus]|uniref:protein geranylgeranyltransferase type II n=1 Tax=Aspergillus avenaceus TaxID=36643 RepID=A0A5N6U1X9_ASPAV|nr:terpenoid cyclases/protein prenyltransferase alpha-alpha toroid [Aspergillus avenaceus]
MALVFGPGRAVGNQSGQNLCIQKHVDYIKNLDSRRDELEYWLTEHLRLNGVYWGLTALHLLGSPQTLPREDTINFVLSCQRDSGGFGAAPGHDAHMLYTVSAVQILVMLGAVDELDKRGLGGKQKIGSFIAGLQDSKTGSFMGDEWGELDTRFLYGAFNALSLLGLLDMVDVTKAVDYVQQCENLDGGYGIRPGAESHAGQVFTCLGALAIAGRLDLVNKDRLGSWLSERQLENGGFNGRPEKLEDACYSWWVGASLAMINKLHWIDGEKLAAFILRCQDPDNGGFGDRPGNMVDVFHTHFAIAGLSLLRYDGVLEVDPVYHQEPQAVVLLDEYDRWYKVNNLAKLLSDRLSSKDARKKKVPGKNVAHDKARILEKATDHKSIPMTVCQPSHDPVPDYLDPRLTSSYLTVAHGIQDKSMSDSMSCVAPVVSSDSGAQADNEVDFSGLPTLSTPPVNTRCTVSPWKQENAYDSEDESAAILQRTPCWSRTLSRTAEMASQLLDRRMGYDPFVDDNESEVERERVDEIGRLKGVLWPGMDIFDSATEQMRRKRNQKKDESILRMMEKTSVGVEPTELIFSPTGILRKQRVISGNVEDSSPLKGETPIPRRRTTRPKRVLSLADPNVEQSRVRKRNKKPMKRDQTTAKARMGRRALRTTRNSSVEVPLHSGNQLCHGESNDDFVLTFSGNDSRVRTDLKIFCDMEDKDGSGAKEQYCEKGLQFGISASSDPLFLHQEALTNRIPNLVHSGNYLSDISEGLGRLNTDKENIEPLLDIDGRIDPLVEWHSPAFKRHLASDAGYLPHLFLSDDHRIGLNFFDGPDCFAGYTYNPLATSCPKLTEDENPIYTSDANQSLASHDTTCTASPDATISDIEEDDFERLYLDGGFC